MKEKPLIGLARKETLKSYHILDTLPEKDFDAITELAAYICETPISLFSLSDDKRQFFKSRHGFKISETPIENSFCFHALARPDQPFIIPDAVKDHRFKNCSLVTQYPNVAFYAGIPLKTSEGVPIGTLCVMDHQPRNINENQLNALTSLANQVEQLLELRKSKLITKGILQKLEKEQDFSKKLIENTCGIFWEADAQTFEFTYISPQVEKILGYTVDEWLSEPQFWQNKIHPEDRENAIQTCHIETQHLRDHTFDYRMKKRNGDYIWLEDRVKVYEKDNRPYRIAGQMIDISKKKMLANTLQSESQLIKDLIKNLPTVFFLFDKDGNHLLWNDALVHYSGYSNEEIKNKTPQDLYRGKQKELVTAAIATAFSQGNVELEAVMTGKKGRETHFLFKGAKTIYQGKPCIFGTGVDIDRIKKAEKELVNSEKRFKSLVQDGGDMMAILDPSGNYTYVSSSSKTVLDIPPENFVGTNAFDYIHPEDLEMIQQSFQKLNHQKQVTPKPFRFRHKNGEWRWLETRLTNLLDEEAVKGIVANSRDITEQQHTKKKLEEANERFELLNQSSSECIYEFYPKTYGLYLGKKFIDLFGIYPSSDQENLSLLAKHLVPEDHKQLKYSFVKTIKDKNQTQWLHKYRIKNAHGDMVWVEDKAVILRNSHGHISRMVGTLKDITQTHYFKQIDLVERDMLSMAMQKEVSLKPIMERFLTQLEQLFPGMRASIMQVKQHKLFTLSGPNLPQEFLQKIDGEPIGENAGSCGTAAYKKTPVIIEDALNDPHWKSYVHLAKKFDIRACWSYPVFNSSGEVVATLAIYYKEPKKPNPYERIVLERSQKLLSLTLSKFDYQHHIEESNKRFQLIHQATKDAIYAWDLNEDHLNFGKSFINNFGHQIDLNRPIPLSKWEEWVHPNDLPQAHKALMDFLNDKKQERWEYPYRFMKANGKYAFVEEIGLVERDKEGKALKMVGVMRDVTQTRELEKLLDNATQLSRVGGWEVDLTTGLHQWSTVTKAILGVTEDFLPNLDKISKFCKPAILEEVKGQILKCIKTGETFDVEIPILTAKRKELWIKIIGNSEIVNGKCIRLFGSVQDIDQRIKIKLELHQKNELLHALNVVIGAFLQEEDWLQEPTHLFEIVGNTLQIDRIAYFKNEISNKSETKFILQDFVWTNPSIKPSINREIKELDQLKSGYLKYGNSQFNKAEPLYIQPSELSEGGFGHLLEKTGIKSVLLLPIVSNKNQYGFLVLEDWGQKRIWSEIEKNFMQTISTNLAVAIKRKHDEKKLTSALRERSTILEGIGEGFCAISRDWTVTYWNKQAEEIFSLPRKRIEGKNIWKVFWQAVGSPAWKVYHEVMETQKKQEIEVFYEPVKKWFEIGVYPTEMGISVFFKDITHRITAQEEIQKSNERFEMVIKATNEAIWDFDIEENRLFWGPGFKTLFGYDPHFITPNFEFWASLIHKEDRKRIMKKIIAYQQGKITDPNWKEEYRFLKKDGNYAYVLDKAIFIRNKNGHVIRAIGAMSDISQSKAFEVSLKKLNQELESHIQKLGASNRELEQFAYVASHDLQEPLRMVSSFMAQLKRKYGEQLDEKAHQYMYFAIDGATRMRQIILDLLEFSRIGRQDFSLDQVNINAVLEEVLVLNKKIIEDLGAKIEFQDMPIIQSYKTPIFQIFQNLIGNALKYAKPNVAPHIIISCQIKNNHWQFMVKDNGIGIDQAYHEKIFEIFQRLHAKNEYSGTGVGLSIVKKIVENLGGNLWVESQPGKGSTFYFTIKKVSNPT